MDESQRTAARVAGFAYLITFAIVVYVNFGIHARLITGSSAAETARNIQAHELLFRIGIAADLIYCAGVVVLLTALYVVLRPVNRGLALLAALWRLIWVFMWLMMTLNLFDSLRLLSGAKYLGAFETDRLQDLARFYLGIGIHRMRLPVVKVPLHPSGAGGLRLGHVRICRGLYIDFFGLPWLRQDHHSVVVRCPDGPFRYRAESVALIQRISTASGRWSPNLSTCCVA